MVCRSRLIMFYFKEKFCVSYASASCLWDIYCLKPPIRPGGKNYISGHIWHKSFIQTVKSSFFKQIIVNQSFYGVPLTLGFFYFKEKFCVSARVGKSLARYLSSSVYTAFRTCRKKYISGYIWHKSFIQTVQCSFLHQIIARRSLSSRKSCLFRHVFPSRLLGPCLLVSKNVIFRLCLLHEDGIEACIRGSIWQKNSKFFIEWQK